MQGVLKKLSGYTWKPAVKFYLRSARAYAIDSITLQIDPGVFHPGFFFSSKEMYRYLDTLELKGKKIIEIGCGSGLLSILAAKKGADVSAVDISGKAIRCAEGNFGKNKVQVKLFHSDIFDAVPEGEFDLVIVNPPYFPSDPVSDEDHAWYAGKEFQFFEKLFSQSVTRLRPGAEMLLVLSDECDVNRIFVPATKAGLKYSLVKSRKNFWERILLYKVNQ
ncbi:MAG TPA: HemK2/MTQ2 family protein methyltransferase [Bacteroidia bacterium]|jgi:release factor glutamine methyltransferase|nr:HemK2/MTQ2 family protein methyltransferase [Bacteroidia bacterium]